MTATKTMRSKDAARTPAPVTATKHGPTTERAKREARKVIADNMARIEQNERDAARAHNEQGGEPEQPQPDQQQPDQAEQAATPAPGTAATAAQPETPAPGAATAKPASGGKRGPKAKDAATAQPAATSPAKRGKSGKTAKAAKPAKEPKAEKLSCLDAAALVIGKDPIGCKDLIAEMGQRKLWTSPNGKTPDASLYAAITREISAKKAEARFKKVDRGLFVANPGSARK